MPTKFLIATDSQKVLTPTKNQLTGFLQGRGWEVWHWIDDLWLIVGPMNATARTITKEIEAAMPDLAKGRFVVFQVEGVPAYFGRGPKEAWEWMKSHWGPPSGRV